jgi:hypothetical protein
MKVLLVQKIFRIAALTLSLLGGAMSWATSAKFEGIICPSDPLAVAKAFLELQMCPHPESYPYLRIRPEPEAGEGASNSLSEIRTQAEPGYEIDKITKLNAKGSRYEVKFHYFLQSGSQIKAVPDSTVFTTYQGRVKDFMGCASQVIYPKFKVRRETCDTLSK